MSDVLKYTSSLVEEIEFIQDINQMVNINIPVQDKIDLINEFDMDPGLKESLKKLFIGGGVGSLAGGMVAGPLGAAGGAGIGSVLAALYRRAKRNNCGKKFKEFITCLVDSSKKRKP
ncbi:MAG: hypothetical protein H8D97_01120 [Proteobacteria bacterium]|nr:hypothetical protein [Pseudomonadota bacterium]